MTGPHVDPCVLYATVESLDAAENTFRRTIRQLTALGRRLADPRGGATEEDALDVIASVLDDLEDGLRALQHIRPGVEELVDEGLRLRYALRRRLAWLTRDDSDFKPFPPGWGGAEKARRAGRKPK